MPRCVVDAALLDLLLSNEGQGGIGCAQPAHRLTATWRGWTHRWELGATHLVLEPTGCLTLPRGNQPMQGHASSDHTTLLLNCYTKLKDVAKLDAFIQARGYVLRCVDWKGRSESSLGVSWAWGCGQA